MPCSESSCNILRSNRRPISRCWAGEGWYKSLNARVKRFLFRRRVSATASLRRGVNSRFGCCQAVNAQSTLISNPAPRAPLPPLCTKEHSSANCCLVALRLSQE
jgi:hypothetical protein